MDRMIIKAVVIISRLAAGIDIHIHADQIVRSCRSAPVDMENSLHVLRGKLPVILRLVKIQRPVKIAGKNFFHISLYTPFIP